MPYLYTQKSGESIIHRNNIIYLLKTVVVCLRCTGVLGRVVATAIQRLD